MKTIQFTGTVNQIDDLTQNLSDEHLDLITETRVYVVNIDNYEFDTSPKTWDDEKFMSEAEIQGTVYTLPTFQEAFNYEDVNTFTDVIRFINVPLNN